MSSNCLGASIAPIFLRVVLGLTFLWAGLTKITLKMDFTGEDAAQLAKWGIGSGSVAIAPTPTPTPTPDASKPEAPKDTPKDAPKEAQPSADKPAESATTPPPQTISTMPVYGIALMLHHAANPAPKADGSPGMALVPAKAAEGQIPVYLAWACAISELAGGVLVLIGFLARPLAFLLAFNMSVAMWLTQFGPAIASGNTNFGFLPKYGSFDPAWPTFFLQFALGGAALALVFTGAGMLSLDRLFFQRPTVIVKPAPTPAAT